VPAARKPPKPPREPGWFDYHAVLSNRFILGGLGILTVMLVAAIVLFAVGGDGDNGGSNVSAQPTTGPGATAVIGPGTTYAFLGLVRGGILLTVVGRNEGDTWFQVIYPPGSTFRVWVQADAIDIEGDTSNLVIAGPAEGPDIVVPTYAGPVQPLPTEPGGTEIEETPTPVDAEPTRTPRPRFTPAPTWTPRPTATPPGPLPTPASEGRPTP
jgi:uncharacterized protein YraI